MANVNAIVDNLRDEIAVHTNLQLLEIVATRHIIDLDSDYGIYFVQSWIEGCLVHNQPFSKCKQGLDILIANGYTQLMSLNDILATTQMHILNKEIESDAFKIFLYVIDKNLAVMSTPGQVVEMNNEGHVVAGNTKLSDAVYAYYKSRNLRRNIPGAAAATTTKRILKNKLNMTNRLGPVNIIGKMMGAPATVRRARKTRRRKN